MVTGEVDIGLRQYPIHPIIQAILLDHWVFIVMVMAEVNIGLIPANFHHINMVYYTLPTQVSLKNILQGVCNEKIHIKIIFNILIQ